MTNLWSFTIDYLYPIPLISLFLLTIPLPNYWRDYVRHQVLRFLDAVIFCQVYNRLTLCDIATVFSVFLFLMTGLDSLQDSNRTISNDSLERVILKSTEDVTREEVITTLIRCNLWREERNFLISSLSLVLWLVLFRIRMLIKEIDKANKGKLNGSKSK